MGTHKNQRSDKLPYKEDEMTVSLAEAKLSMTRRQVVKGRVRVERFLFIDEETVNSVFQISWT
jgi:hypothetical protein